MRKTIHLIPADDAGWWLPLFEPMIERWSRRRLEQLGMPGRTQDKALRVIGEALDSEGPLTRPELRERVTVAGVKLDQQTGMHIALCAVVSGIACLGPDRGAQTCLVRREDWLGKLSHVDREEALAELARRYIHAFAPATDRDFAYWAGLPLRDVRAGLKGIASEIEEVRVGEEEMLVPRERRPRVQAVGNVRLLGNFDTYLLGWKDRSFSVAEEHAAAVKEGGGGWIRPVIVRDGVVIGGWRSRRTSGRLEIRLDLPDRLSGSVREAIEAEIEDIARFEGMKTELVR